MPPVDQGDQLCGRQGQAWRRGLATFTPDAMGTFHTLKQLLHVISNFTYPGEEPSNGDQPTIK
jgi:hypothetical protein